MTDFDKTSDELAARAVLAAGEEGAKRLAARLTPDDEDGASPNGTAAAPAKSRRYKLIAIGLFALLVLVGLLGLVVSYWHWFLLAGLAGLFGLYGWYWLRKRLRSRREPEQAKAPEPRVAARERVALPERDHAAERIERARARASEQRELDDELAALKARVQK